MSTRERFDVVIAGGGPAGSSTANYLRQKGRSVLVLERELFPRFHLGESLLPFGNDIWKELGVFDQMNEQFVHKPGARFIHEESGEEFTYYFDNAIRSGNPYAFQVKRELFDKMLLERAAALGAIVREQTTVKNVDFSTDGVVVHTVGVDGVAHEVAAAMFIDATGRDALIAGKRGLKVHDELVTTNVALNCTFAGVPLRSGLEEGNIIIGLFDGGWYWVIPFADGDTSVGFVLEKSYTKVNRGLSREDMFAQVLAGLPHLSKLLEGTRPLMAVGSEANWSYRAKQFYGDRLLMVGDAAAFVDPLFSTGVLLAIHGAKFAAMHADAALTDGDFSAERFAGYQAECVAGMDIFRNLVAEFYAENLRKILMSSAVNPTICSVIVSVLAGDVYKPSMWHSAVNKPGFSSVPPSEMKGLAGTYTSSREVMKASGLPRAGETT
ncbi:MAG: NAD(P)/FAD-dependent oxidoreductase [Polyangia bacterium]